MNREDVDCGYLFGDDNNWSMCRNCPEKCGECNNNYEVRNAVKNYFKWMFDFDRKWKQTTLDDFGE